MLCTYSWLGKKCFINIVSEIITRTVTVIGYKEDSHDDYGVVYINNLLTLYIEYVHTYVMYVPLH